MIFHLRIIYTVVLYRIAWIFEVENFRGSVMDHQNFIPRNIYHVVNDLWVWPTLLIFLLLMMMIFVIHWFRCVHLVAELSQLKPYVDKISSLLPSIAESARHKHYAQHYSYLETVFKQVNTSTSLYHFQHTVYVLAIWILTTIHVGACALS